MYLDTVFSRLCCPCPSSPVDTCYAQLRLYGGPGCFRQNWGELGVYGKYMNVYNNFSNFTVQSVSYDLANNYTCK
ncbi:uncharacterized protein N7483_012512 [Penicillium malachiteum]|uniref:uncharacterized protein n=1 Tax=Penicillium malachiteum TaxID=1324776 RepID=UPI002547938B|nr:uncharacterized protein N7483_012512 [Penicillium malachiteum]KAJ5715331.1 hypothetical protein N7483_012512 [Penicillium malachiteum]